VWRGEAIAGRNAVAFALPRRRHRLQRKHLLPRSWPRRDPVSDAVANQFIERAGGRRTSIQPAVLGIALDQPARVRQPADALAQRLHQVSFGA
jgi:hypothetical protein